MQSESCQRNEGRQFSDRERRIEISLNQCKDHPRESAERTTNDSIFCEETGVVFDRPWFSIMQSSRLMTPAKPHREKRASENLNFSPDVVSIDP